MQQNKENPNELLGQLKIQLANYRELQSFSQFGSDLDAATQRVLNHGRVLEQVLRQKQYEPYSVERQIYELFVAQNDFLEKLASREIEPALTAAYEALSVQHPEYIEEIVSKKIISDELNAKLLEFSKVFFNARYSVY